MPAKKYRVKLTGTERSELQVLFVKGRVSARKRNHARILLQADEGEQGPGWKDAKIAEVYGTSVPTIERVRKAFVEEGLERALTHKRTYRSRRKLDGAQEARLIALTCSEPPDGREHWTMQMLADKLVELEVVESISDETVRTTLKKTNSSRG
jgi:transposase